MKVWRIEGDGGNGPFGAAIWELPNDLQRRASSMMSALDADWYRHTNPKMPAVFQVGIHKCAFKTKKQMLTFFTPKALRILAQSGYVAKRIQVPDDTVLITADQLAFERIAQ